MPKKGSSSWKRREEILSGDHVFQGRPDDIIILVMGPTGTGKSSFINTIIGDQVMEVSDDPDSCTKIIQETTFDITQDMCASLVGRRVVLVDTPGFNDTYESDYEILRRIAAWLAATYDDGVATSGLIYLHDITELRMTGSIRRYLDIFRELCGRRAPKKIVLLTTKWGNSVQKTAETRETKLSQSHWKSLIEAGMTLQRFDQTPACAWGALSVILSTQPKTESIILRIQQELVQAQKHVIDTKAAKGLQLTEAEFAKIRQEAGHSDASSFKLLSPLKSFKDKLFGSKVNLV